MRVLKSTAGLGVIILVVLAVLKGRGIAQTKPPDAVYVSQTGHWIRGDFYQFYQNMPEPTLLLGYPITDELVDPVNGRKVQYFERARLDISQDGAGGQVEIAPLGKLLYVKGSPLASVSQNGLGCRFFPATGHRVCYAFRQFYEQHHGEEFFGNPLSDLEMHQGLVVQYFERARLEWHAERMPGQRVTLSDLGRVYFETRMGDWTLSQPSAVEGFPTPQRAFHLHAFVDKLLVSSNSLGTLFVIAHDPFSFPARGATVRAGFVFPDGRQNTYQLPPIGEDGISQMDFVIGEMPPNQMVEIKVDVHYEGQTLLASTWFRTPNISP
ncbi:MAG: hypothetical protein HPY45_00435 [Anaerolineae bacterium]|nr:hypothetical protein [Anaerolineae bacterium]